MRLDDPRASASTRAASNRAVGGVDSGGANPDGGTSGGAEFGVGVIPETRSATTLGAAPVGSRVNLEVDVVAKYVERLLASQGGATGSPVATGTAGRPTADAETAVHAPALGTSA